MQLEQGHRQRLRRRFRQEGLEGFHELHALELLLCYAIPQKDTKPLARALLDRFGSYAGVLEASYADLCGVEGVGEAVATYLMLVMASFRYYRSEKAQTRMVLGETEAIGELLLAQYQGRGEEAVYLVCLDGKAKLLGCHLVGKGDVNSASIPKRRVVELALADKATYAVLAHNHPSGVALPSPADLTTTQEIAAALGAVGIMLADHLVMADEDYVSMAQSRLFVPGDYCQLQ